MSAHVRSSKKYSDGHSVHIRPNTCADPEISVRWGPPRTMLVFRGFFLINEGRVDQNTTKSGQSLACLQNAIEMAICWLADDGPTLNACLVFQGNWTNIAKEPYSFLIFQWGLGALVPPTLDPHMKYEHFFRFRRQNMV